MPIAHSLTSTSIPTCFKNAVARTDTLDYAPFGGQISRSGQDCYGGASSEKPLFTGQMRDGESTAGTDTGQDYFNARYFWANTARFTSPDAPFADQRPEDGQSWNMYAYVRNNPLRLVDPTGRAATITSTCTTSEGQTTCEVQIRATAAFYARDELSRRNATQYVANETKRDIEKAWTGTYVENGVTYNIKANVDVQVYGSEKEALDSGAQNVIGVQSNPVGGEDSGGVPVAEVSRRPLGYSGADRAVISWSADSSSRAHEFGHMMGVGHHKGNYLMSPNPTLLNATPSDFGWALGPSLRNQRANEHVNPSLRGMPAVYRLQARPIWWFGR